MERFLRKVTMTSLWNLIFSQLTSNNQFFSGGLSLLIIGGAVAYLRSVPSTIYSYFLRAFTVSLSVTSDDDIFRWIMLWLNSQGYTQRTRRLSIREHGGKAILVPAKGDHLFRWGARLVWLKWVDEEGKLGGASGISDLVSRQKVTIRILGRDRQCVMDFLNETASLMKEDTGDKLKTYLRKGDWDSGWRMELRDKRSLNTIFLPPEAQTLLKDMQAFLDSKEKYQKLGIPYRRGYLFHGPPGNGKSSLALGLASSLSIPLYVLNIGAITNDAGLEKAIYTIDCSNPLILLIEDIDTAMPNRDGGKANTFSLGTLLNVLDGVVARENLLLIVTTNRKDVLDPALLRPGRVDRQVEFVNATPAQIVSAIKLFFPEGSELAETLLLDCAPRSMAQVQETLLSLNPTILRTQ